MTSDDIHSSKSFSTKKIKALLKRMTEYQVAQQELFEEVKKEASSLIESNEKLRSTANENARLVTHTQNRCREFKHENQALKHELAVIKTYRQHETQSAESDDASTRPKRKEDVSIGDQQPEKLERKGLKLSTNKQKKKVRYQKLPDEEKKSPVLLITGRRENQDPEADHPILEEEERGGCPQTANRQPSKGDSPPDRWIGSVFVAETVPLDVESDSDDGEDTEEGNGVHKKGQCREGGGGYRMSRNLRKHRRHRYAIDQHVVIPETVPMDCVSYSPSGDSLPEDVLMGDGREHLLPLEQSTPMLPTLPSDSSRRRAINSRSSASPVCWDGKSSKKSKIPPTESQLSVDFSTTQMSPTFDGSRSTPDKKESDVHSRSKQQFHPKKTVANNKISIGNIPMTPENFHSNGKVKTSGAKTPGLATPEDADHAKSSHIVTPDYDESGQSEASFLILQQPPSLRGSSQVRSSGGLPIEDVVQPIIQRKFPTDSDAEQRKKRKLSDECMNEIASKKTKTIRPDLPSGSSKRDEYKFSNRGGREEKCSAKSESSEPSEKWSSAEAPVRKSHHSEETRSSQVTRDHSISLKQTTLTKDSFKAVITEDGQRLKKLNGGARVYVDSQNDPYMQQAIQESIEVQKELESTGSFDFKVPKLPKAQECDHNLKGPSSWASSRRHHQEDADIVVLVEEREDASSAGRDNPDDDYGEDLNGSIDPAVRFSFIGSERDVDSGDGEMEPIEARRADASGNLRKPLDNSKAAQHRDGTNLHREHYDNVEGGRSNNKHKLLVEDSFDDMFADDDHDSSNDDDDHHGSHRAYDRQDQDIEVVEDDGPAAGDINETPVQRRTGCEDGSLPDPGLDPGIRQREETDEMVSSFVREFDCPPQKDDIPAYKFKDVVRKRDERQKLKGYGCQECLEVCTVS
nr:uncharacterized protein LOC129263150 [Lytechinus pictus]